jgi:hypothetical protein
MTYLYNDDLGIFGGNVYVTEYLGIEVYQITNNSIANLISSNVVAIASGDDSGLINATWNCPQVELNSTDAIQISVYVDAFNPPTFHQVDFITEELGAVVLNNNMWSVFYYLNRSYIPSFGYTRYDFLWGNATYNSRIDNFKWSSSAPSDWANSNLAYRQSEIINSASGADVSYQVQIVVVNSSGTSSGNVMHENNRCRSDFGDIRFYSNDNLTNLNYWNESYNAGKNITCWVRMPSDNTYGNLSSSNQVLWVYYGNSTTTTAANGLNTFLFFDDFSGASLNTTLWSTSGTSTTYNKMTVSNSILTFKGNDTGGWNYLIGDVGLGVYNVRTKMDAALNLTRCAGAMGENGIVNQPEALFYMQTGTYYAYCGGTYSAQTITISGLDTSYHLDEVDWISGNLSFFVDGAYKANETTSAYIPSAIIYDKLAVGYGSKSEIYVDWIFSSKYVSPEPSNGAWTSEQIRVTAYYRTGISTINMSVSASRAETITKSGTITLALQALETQTISVFKNGIATLAMIPSLTRSESVSKIGVTIVSMIVSEVQQVFVFKSGIVYIHIPTSGWEWPPPVPIPIPVIIGFSAEDVFFVLVIGVILVGGSMFTVQKRKDQKRKQDVDDLLKNYQKRQLLEDESPSTSSSES